MSSSFSLIADAIITFIKNLFHFPRKYNVLRTLVKTSVSFLHNLLSSSPKQANLGMYEPMCTPQKCDISLID